MTADMPRYLGLTWDHPRGYRALDAAAAADASMNLRWDRQSLEGFEAHPIADLAQRYDLILLDHPHLGDAVAGQCLVPLESLFSAVQIAAWGAACVGRSFASYHYAGSHWALPLDAAAQVTACRPDLLHDEPPPRTWEAVIALAQRLPVCLSLGGPHAAVTFMSLCAALGEPVASKDPALFVSPNVGAEAYAIVSAIQGRANKLVSQKNPKGILEEMASGGDIAYCPLIFGYVNYSAAGFARHAIRFGDVPVTHNGGPLGSTIGGTGLAVTRRAVVTPQLIAHLGFLMSDQTQRCFIPRHGGQPSAHAAWRDATVNTQAGKFYSATLRTVEAAWVRPRFENFVPFQATASAAIRLALETGTPALSLLAELQELYVRSRCGGRKRTPQL
jgi:multiple sugar transport system substrate-binding protein